MEEENENTLNESSQQITNNSKVTYDPGWNDPPKLSYGGSVGQTKFIKKGLLNKRVAFPLSSNASAPVAPFSSNQSATPPKGDTLFPLSSSDSPADVPKPLSHSPFLTTECPTVPDRVSPKNLAPQTLLDSTQTLPDSQRDEDGESSLDKVMDCFEKVISELVTPENADKIEGDIRKRLETMKKMWMEDKLNKAVKQKMVLLAEALQRGEGSLANDIHIEIIVDHTGQVNTWMPGVRKLVHCSILAAKEMHEEKDIEIDVAEKEDLQQTNEQEKATS